VYAKHCHKQCHHFRVVHAYNDSNKFCVVDGDQHCVEHGHHFGEFERDQHSVEHGDLECEHHSNDIGQLVGNHVGNHICVVDCDQLGIELGHHLGLNVAVRNRKLICDKYWYQFCINYCYINCYH
jgi:hypothetical protein